MRRFVLARSSAAALVDFLLMLPPTSQIDPLSLHDALPISACRAPPSGSPRRSAGNAHFRGLPATRSEEHTSELQSQFHLVCRLLLEKKKTLRQLETRVFTRCAAVRKISAHILETLSAAGPT